MKEEKDRTVALSHAVKALAEGRQEEAAEAGRRLLRRWPDDAGVRQFMAALTLRQSNPAEAERWALSSLEARPDHAATWVLAALAARAQGDGRVALDRYRRAAELEPRRAEAAFGAAGAAIAIYPATAASEVGALKARFPDPSPAWADIGGLLERAALWELAAEAYELALRAAPSALLWLRFGVCRQSLGRRSEAASAYRNALQLDPASAEAWFKLGLAMQDGKRADLAIAAYRRALALRPDLAEAEANLGVALQEQGELHAAKQAYGRAINLMPSAFGRVAQALSTAPKGELWLELSRLRAHLSELGRLSR
jgi:tetratricopeptide (TPR) repeat protein